MTDIGLRLNLDAEEVELTVDGKVAFTSGSDVFKSWVDAFNEKHKPTVQEPVEEKVVTPEAPVEDAPVDPENPVQEGVDDSEKE